MFTLMACHSKLTEIYTSLFQMMDACINYTLFPSVREDWAILLPKLEVGTVFAPPLQVDIKRPIASGAESTLYMILIAMMSAQLWERLLEVVRLSVCEVLGWEQMRESLARRTESMVRTIEKTKMLLQPHSTVAK